MQTPAVNAKGTDADRLIRQKAGTYRTADERFEVQQAATGWFAVDSQNTNEFGQPVMLGPFPTLDGVRGALPDARKARPMRPTKPPALRGRSAKASAKPEPAPAKPKPPQQTWIEKLSTAEGNRVRALIRALEREGVQDAEQVVRADRDGLLPAVATRLIERRLEAVVEEADPKERKQAKELVRRAAEVLTADGTGMRAPLPKWALVEIGPKPEPGNRRIVMRRGR